MWAITKGVTVGQERAALELSLIGPTSVHDRTISSEDFFPHPVSLFHPQKSNFTLQNFGKYESNF
jgi:hypothetical protein